jgi:site-specific recombinase XerD
VRERRRYLPPFFEWMGPERLKKDGLKDLTPEILQRFILEYSSGNKPRRVARVAMAMRGFCRFCLQRGYVDRDLTAAIPSYCQRAHSRLPSGISEEDAQRALAGIDRSSPIGKRDYAILQVLHAYGVRSSHISLLRLEDIDWPAGLIHFRALKRGKSIVVPITDAVGNSLLDYLRGARPQSGQREVFLTLRPPGRVFGETAVTVIVGRRLANAGVDMFPHGAGVFRHGFATRMLAQGNTLKSIADILGHRNLGTTSIYAKVDFRALESVALEWPEDRS